MKNKELDVDVNKAYREWMSTGILISDYDVVMRMADRFKSIVDTASGFDQYTLMVNDARKEYDRLFDIIKSRYGLDEQRPANCRNELRDKGLSYPRSGCAVCRNGGLMGCPYEKMENK